MRAILDSMPSVGAAGKDGKGRWLCALCASKRRIPATPALTVAILTRGLSLGLGNRDFHAGTASLAGFDLHTPIAHEFQALPNV